RRLLLQAELQRSKTSASGYNGVFVPHVLLGVDARLGHRAEAQLLADSLLEATRHDTWQFPREEETVARAWVAFHDFDRAIPLLEHALSVPAGGSDYARLPATRSGLGPYS